MTMSIESSNLDSIGSLAQACTGLAHGARNRVGMLLSYVLQTSDLCCARPLELRAEHTFPGLVVARLSLCLFTDNTRHDKALPPLFSSRGVYTAKSMLR